MLKRKYCLEIVIIAFVALLVSGLSGCGTFKGFGHDISNAAQAGENVINGDPISYRQTHYVAQQNGRDN